MAMKKSVDKTDSENNEKSFDYSVFDIVIERCAKGIAEEVCNNVKEILGLPLTCTYERIEKIEAGENIAKVILERAIDKVPYQFNKRR